VATGVKGTTILHNLKRKGELMKIDPLEKKVDRAAMRIFGFR
jgi:hypothetical protein